MRAVTFLRREAPFLSLAWPNSSIAAFLKRFFFLQLIANGISMAVQRSLAYPPMALAASYNVAKENIPLLALGLLLYGIPLHAAVRKLINVGVASVAIAAAVAQAVTGALWTGPIFGIYWQYHALYLYVGLFFAVQWLLRRNGFTGTQSLILGLLTAKVVGLLYELPIYPVMNPYVGMYFHRMLPFFICGDWIILVGLAWWMLRRVELRLTPAHFSMAGAWVSFSIVYHFHPWSLTAFLPRLPTALLALAVVYVAVPKTLCTTYGSNLHGRR